MPASSVLAFWVVAALLIAVPGPDWAFAISAGLRGHVVAAAGGIVLGYLAMTIVVATGLGILIARAPAALTVLTVAGGCYLVWLGVKIWRHPSTPGTENDAVGGGRLGTVLRGTAVSGLNPKGLLIFVAMLPQFTDRTASWPLPVQLAILGLAFTVTCAVVYLAVGTCARRLLRARPSFSRLVSRVSGGAMIAVGIALLVERVSG
ncbi:LysE family translocator [Pseudonocardia acaciae]|uniref:LysE family translocator n=1 Tax=Pseudonocardia acaciae TaxID=551276 RepID=UPI00048D57DD|nr:LysE family translocator [Pseudonocardia acaciae]